jgi:pyruvate dehydrogenase E2 component (dihydrolipoamide acetyltransferase)
MMPLSLTFDHRILDGAEATRFLADLMKYLSNPELIMAEQV